MLDHTQEIIKLEAKGRRVLAGEDSWTTLFQTFNTAYVRTALNLRENMIRGACQPPWVGCG